MEKELASADVSGIRAYVEVVRVNVGRLALVLQKLKTTQPIYQVIACDHRGNGDAIAGEDRCGHAGA